MKGNVSKAKGGSGSITVSDGKVFVSDGGTKIELQQAYRTYGVSIDLTNSNPETAVTYTDDAVGMVAGSPDWYKMSIFKKIKPCLFKAGMVVGYLNPDNFAQFEDGMPADITSGNSGDVMIEIPKTGFKIAKSGTTLTVQITDEPYKAGFSYMAHTRDIEGDRDKLYIGAFLGSSSSGVIQSISGREPNYGLNISDQRDIVGLRGQGYDLMSFYPLTLLQCLYLVMFKNLNSQQALGMGYVSGVSVKNTGATVDKGMNYGTTSSTEQMKFLGIEDLWGNLYQWVDGLVTTSDGHVLVATKEFNDAGEGYIDLGALSTNIVYNYMKEPFGNNQAGFIMKESGGSATTYFSDFSNLGASNPNYIKFMPRFGADYYASTYGGMFQLYCINLGPGGGGATGERVGIRLMFL